MPRGFGRLLFLARRGATADQALGQAHGVEAPIDVDDAPVGPPVLLPAMIHRMILVDATELTPVWAKPRSPRPPETAGIAATTGPTHLEPAVSSAEPPAHKPPRKRKTSDSSGGPKAPTSPRSARKPPGTRRRSS